MVFKPKSEENADLKPLKVSFAMEKIINGLIYKYFDNHSELSWMAKGLVSSHDKVDTTVEDNLAIIIAQYLDNSTNFKPDKKRKNDSSIPLAKKIKLDLATPQKTVKDISQCNGVTPSKHLKNDMPKTQKLSLPTSTLCETIEAVALGNFSPLRSIPHHTFMEPDDQSTSNDQETIDTTERSGHNDLLQETILAFGSSKKSPKKNKESKLFQEDSLGFGSTKKTPKKNKEEVQIIPQTPKKLRKDIFRRILMSIGFYVIERRIIDNLLKSTVVSDLFTLEGCADKPAEVTQILLKMAHKGLILHSTHPESGRHYFVKNIHLSDKKKMKYGIDAEAYLAAIKRPISKVTIHAQESAELLFPDALNDLKILRE